MRECFLYPYLIWKKNAGPWQVMLKQTDGSFACVAESPTRFTLGEVCALKAFNLLNIVFFIQSLGKK
jgi:hypothetical protein